MKNHVSMGDILTMTPDELINLPVDQLLLIQEEIAAQSESLKQVKMVFEGILENRYSEQAEQAYSAKGDVYGKTNFRDDFTIVEVNTVKKVTWDQDALKIAERVIGEDWNENPEEYMQYKRTVSESAYKNWPSAIRKLFEPARTEEAGKRSFVIKDASEKREVA